MEEYGSSNPEARKDGGRRGSDRSSGAGGNSSPRASALLRQLANQRDQRRTSLIAGPRGRLFSLFICGSLALFSLVAYCTSLRLPGYLGSIIVQLKKSEGASSFLEGLPANGQTLVMVPAQPHVNPAWGDIQRFMMPSSSGGGANDNVMSPQGGNMVPFQSSVQQQPQEQQREPQQSQPSSQQQESQQQQQPSGQGQAGQATQAQEEQLQKAQQNAEAQHQVQEKQLKNQQQQAEQQHEEKKSQDPNWIGKLQLSPLLINVSDMDCSKLPQQETADECTKIFKRFEGSPLGLKKRLCKAPSGNDDKANEEKKDSSSEEKKDSSSDEKEDSSSESKMCKQAQTIPKWFALSIVSSAIAFIGFAGILLLCTPWFEMEDRDRDVWCISIAVVSAALHVFGLICLGRISSLLSSSVMESVTSNGIFEAKRYKIRMVTFLTLQALAACLVPVVLITEEGYRRKRPWTGVPPPSPPENEDSTPFLHQQQV